MAGKWEWGKSQVNVGYEVLAVVPRRTPPNDPLQMAGDLGSRRRCVLRLPLQAISWPTFSVKQHLSSVTAKTNARHSQPVCPTTYLPFIEGRPSSWPSRTKIPRCPSPRAPPLIETLQLPYPSLAPGQSGSFRSRTLPPSPRLIRAPLAPGEMVHYAVAQGQGQNCEGCFAACPCQADTDV